MSLRQTFRTKSGIAGWGVAAFWLLLRVLERLHFAEWLYHKLVWLGPLMPPLVEVLSSWQFQLSLMVLAVTLILLGSRSGDALTVLRDKGRKLLNEQITQEYFKRWWERVDLWRLEVDVLLRDRYTEADLAEFRNPGPFMTRPYPDSIDVNHANIRRVLGHHLEVVDNIMARHRRAFWLAPFRRAKPARLLPSTHDRIVPPPSQE